MTQNTQNRIKLKPFCKKINIEESVLTPEIIKKAKARVDTYVGTVDFTYGSISFSVHTRHGIRAARQYALEGKRILLIKVDGKTI